MRGLTFYKQNGYDADPEKLVSDTINRIFISQPQPQAPAAATPQVNAPKPTIPVVKGSGSSVVAKRANSFEDLRKARAKYSY